MKYEDTLLEQFKKDKQIADNELAVTARKFLKNKKERGLVESLLRKKKR